MAADAEAALISKIVYTGDLESVLEAQISGRHFHDPEHATVWDWLSWFYGEYQTCPGREALREEFPAYTLLKVPEPLPYYIDRAVAAHKRTATFDVVMEAAQLIEGEEVDAALATMSDGLLSISDATTKSRDDNLIESWEARMARYREIQDHDGELVGIPTGFPTFDEITGGWQAEQLGLLVGPQKAGKSGILLAMAMAANDAGHKVAFFGFEMSNEEQGARYDGLRAGFNYNRMLNGQMTKADWAKLEEAGKRQASNPPMIFVHDPTSTTTMTAVSAKIHRYKPDIVFIDGVYLMDSEVEGVESMDTKALTKISRGAKRLAQSLKIPVIISTQVLDWKWNPKTGLTTRSVGYCVDDQTEILTDHGWVTYDRLHEGDTVLTLDHKDGRSEWQQVQEVCVFPAMEREMVLMEGQGHSSLTTPNHRWPVMTRHRMRRKDWPEQPYIERRWVTTETLTYEDAIPLSAPNKSLPVEAVYDDAFVELVSWFWTEGGKHSSSSGVTITQSYSVNPDNTARIHAALTKVFGPESQERSGERSQVPVWRETWRRGTTAEFWINAAGGRLLLEAAPDKVPTHKFLLSLTREQLDLFIEISMRADNAGERTLAQKNPAAAEAFQFACVLAGRASTRSERPPTSSTPYPMHSVYLKQRAALTPVASAAQGRKFSISRQRYDGIIWCPRTPNQSWLARRNGTVYFTGNTSAFGQDCDWMFGIEPADDEGMAKCRLITGRRYSRRLIMVHMDWDNGSLKEVEESGWAGSDDDFGAGGDDDVFGYEEVS